MAEPEIYDLFVIGGGINGAGVARDAAGRGLKVVLAEKTTSPKAPRPAQASLCMVACVISNITNFALSAKR